MASTDTGLCYVSFKANKLVAVDDKMSAVHAYDQYCAQDNLKQLTSQPMQYRQDISQEVSCTARSPLPQPFRSASVTQGNTTRQSLMPISTATLTQTSRQMRLHGGLTCCEATAGFTSHRDGAASLQTQSGSPAGLFESTCRNMTRDDRAPPINQ
jgi:hypothetical protein